MSCDVFAGTYTYKAGCGPYQDKGHENWKFVDVPAELAGRGTAQTFRVNCGAESARMFAYDEAGFRVYWYERLDFITGGSTSGAIETLPEAKRRWDEKTADSGDGLKVRRIEMSLYAVVENEPMLVGRMHWKRAEEA